MLAAIERFIVDKFIVLMIAGFVLGVLLQTLADAINLVHCYLDGDPGADLLPLPIYCDAV